MDTRITRREIQEIREIITIEKLRMYRKQCWLQDTFALLERIAK